MEDKSSDDQSRQLFKAMREINIAIKTSFLPAFRAFKQVILRFDLLHRRVKRKIKRLRFYRYPTSTR